MSIPDVPDGTLHLPFLVLSAMDAAAPSFLETIKQKVEQTPGFKTLAKYSTPLLVLPQTMLTSRLIAECTKAIVLRASPIGHIAPILNPTSILNPIRLSYAILSTVGLWVLSEVAARHNKDDKRKKFHNLFEANRYLNKLVNTIGLVVLAITAIMAGKVVIPLVCTLFIAIVWLPAITSKAKKQREPIPSPSILSDNSFLRWEVSQQNSFA